MVSVLESKTLFHCIENIFVNNWFHVQPLGIAEKGRYNFVAHLFIKHPLGRKCRYYLTMMYIDMSQIARLSVAVIL